MTDDPILAAIREIVHDELRPIRAALARIEPLVKAVMAKTVRDRIAAGLREAIAVARGEQKPARLHAEIDVKTIRGRAARANSNVGANARAAPRQNARGSCEGEAEKLARLQAGKARPGAEAAEVAALAQKQRQA